MNKNILPNITVLAGGVGAAKFLQGLVKVYPEEKISIIVNTGDDIELYGLRISPDVDIITYTLAGMVDEEKGWGFKNDTFHCLEILGTYGLETWFKLGDKDLGTHIFRTWLLRRGFSLSDITDIIRKRLNVKTKIIPMTNDYFQTKIKTKDGIIHFQEFYVKFKSSKEILDIIYDGAENAKPAPGVIDSILNAKAIIICPSNPFVSIGTILSIQGVKEAIFKSKAPVVAISPIIAGKTVKGPADKMLKAMGFEPTAYGVAKYYRGLLDIFFIDHSDRKLKNRIEKELNMKVITTDILMRNLNDKIRLASEVLDALGIKQRLEEE